MSKKEPELEIGDDPHQQRYEWMAERWGWIAFTVLLIAVACGLFGRGGPLSTVRLASPDGSVQIEYERFLRYHSPDTLRIALTRDAAKGQAPAEVRLALDSGYVQEIQFDRITPAPVREAMEDGAVAYQFRVQAGAPGNVTFHFTPQTYGSLEGWITVDGGNRLPISHFIYP